MTQDGNITQAVQQFMRTAGLQTDNFDAQQACLYTGLQLEEMAEKLEAIATGCVSLVVIAHLHTAADNLRLLSSEFKEGKHRGDILRADREKLLDADIDLAWVAIGGAFSTSCNTVGAIGEVARANLDKFPNGTVLRDENGKVKKPANWRGPDLAAFYTPSAA